ncbi:MAG: TMEM43 family protein [Rickettsiales bacterium]|jgi:hypothetical protein|nr:TMEM43 family protein [Rickettsiales bacterium]
MARSLRNFVPLLASYGLLLAMAFLVFFAQEEKARFLEILGEGERFVFIHEDIVNRVNFVDKNIVGVTIGNAFGVKKNVQLYQWVEERRLPKGGSSYVYGYRKQWTGGFLNSDNFQDRTRSNHLDDDDNLKLYESETLLVGNIITKSGFEIDKKYFSDQVRYRRVFFRNPDALYQSRVIRRKNIPRPKIKDDYVDLDSYAADSGLNKKTTVSRRPDVFRVVGGTILYNGRDFSQPEIGDVKIDYEVFSPRKVSFLGTIRGNKLIPYSNLLEIDSSISERSKFVASYRNNSILELTLVFMLLLAVVSILFRILRGRLRRYFLNIIPLFDGFLLPKKGRYIPCLVTPFLFSLALGYRFLSVVLSMVLLILGHRLGRAQPSGIR